MPQSSTAASYDTFRKSFASSKSSADRGDQNTGGSGGGNKSSIAITQELMERYKAYLNNDDDDNHNDTNNMYSFQQPLKPRGYEVSQQTSPQIFPHSERGNSTTAVSTNQTNHHKIKQEFVERTDGDYSSAAESRSQEDSYPMYKFGSESSHASGTHNTKLPTEKLHNPSSSHHPYPLGLYKNYVPLKSSSVHHQVSSTVPSPAISQLLFTSTKLEARRSPEDKSNDCSFPFSIYNVSSSPNYKKASHIKAGASSNSDYYNNSTSNHSPSIIAGNSGTTTIRNNSSFYNSTKENYEPGREDVKMSNSNNNNGTQTLKLASHGQALQKTLCPPLLTEFHKSKPYILNGIHKLAATTAANPTIHTTLKNSESKEIVIPAGVPAMAKITKHTAPVHIDVGGMQYTTTLETLTKYPNSRLAKLFNGGIPIVLDSFKQHYFLNRDGKSFRHILNYLRYEKLLLPANFDEIDLVLEEAKYYELSPMCTALETWQEDKKLRQQHQQAIAMNYCENYRPITSLQHHTNRTSGSAKRKSLFVDNLLAKKMMNKGVTNTVELNGHGSERDESNDVSGVGLNLSEKGIPYKLVDSKNNLSTEPTASTECLILRSIAHQTTRPKHLGVQDVDSDENETNSNNFKIDLYLAGDIDTVNKLLHSTGDDGVSSQRELGQNNCHSNLETLDVPGLGYKLPENWQLSQALQKILNPHTHFRLINSSPILVSDESSFSQNFDKSKLLNVEYIFTRG